MKTFMPPRTTDGKPDSSGFWQRIAVRNMENIEEHPQTMDTSGGENPFGPKLLPIRSE